MVHLVKAYEPGAINLAPQSIEEEVLQNVAMIIGTPQFTVPLDRGFGLAGQFIDKPVQVAQAILISEVMDVVEKYEPRAEIVSVKYELGKTPGQLIPIVEVKIIGE